MGLQVTHSGLRHRLSGRCGFVLHKLFQEDLAWILQVGVHPHGKACRCSCFKSRWTKHWNLILNVLRWPLFRSKSTSRIMDGRLKLQDPGPDHVCASAHCGTDSTMCWKHSSRDLCPYWLESITQVLQFFQLHMIWISLSIASLRMLDWCLVMMSAEYNDVIALIQKPVLLQGVVSCLWKGWTWCTITLRYKIIKINNHSSGIHTQSDHQQQLEALIRGRMDPCFHAAIHTLHQKPRLSDWTRLDHYGAALVSLCELQVHFPLLSWQESSAAVAHLLQGSMCSELRRSEMGFCISWLWWVIMWVTLSLWCVSS